MSAAGSLFPAGTTVSCPDRDAMNGPVIMLE
jgi:hypothetical protein